LARGDARACLAEIADLDQKAPNYLQVLGELARALQLIAVRQVADNVADDDVLPTETLSELAVALTPEDVQLDYQIALHGRRDLPLSADPRGAFEMTLLRMLAFRPQLRVTVESPAKADGGNGREAVAAPSRGERPAVQKLAGAGGGAAGPGTDDTGGEKARKGADAGLLSESHDWDAVVQGLGLKGVALQLARHCRLDRREGGYVRLVLDRRYENLRNKAAEDRLKDALGRAENVPVRLDLVVGDVDGDSPAERASEAAAARREAAADAIDTDPNVAELKSRFGATINPDSIEPLD